MSKGFKGMFNLKIIMVAPYVSGDNNGYDSTWKIVKSRKRIKEEKKSNYKKKFPPLQVLSSTTPKNISDNDDSGSKSSKSTVTHKTPTRKPSKMSNYTYIRNRYILCQSLRNIFLYQTGDNCTSCNNFFPKLSKCRLPNFNRS